jgi:hypothetical protein
VAVAAGVLAGVVLRVLVLRSGLGALDSDEAVAGLIVRHLIQGEPTTFFWGQAYGGTPGTIVHAPFVALLGTTPMALKTGALIVDAAATLLLFAIGRRVAGHRAGVIAALMFWVWPAAYVWWSTKERFLYWPGLALGLVVFLCALRIDEDADRRWDWLILGAAAGVGWWATPQILFFAVPAAVWLAVRHIALWRRWSLTVIAAVVGALPWLVYNARHGMPSLVFPPQPSDQGYFGHLNGMVRKAVPVGLGLRTPYTEQWLGGRAIAVLYLVAVVAVAVQLVRTRSRPFMLIAGALVVFPFIYAISPYTWFTADGRYVLFFIVMATIPLAMTVAHRPVVAGVVVAGLFVLTCFGLRAMNGHTDPFAPDVAVPHRIGRLVTTLDREGITRVFTDYWIAYRLTYETDEEVIAAPVSADRRPAYQDAVRRDPDPAWVVVAGSARIDGFEAALRERQVGFRRIRAGAFLVYDLDRRVLPEELPAEVLP